MSVRARRLAACALSAILLLAGLTPTLATGADPGHRSSWWVAPGVRYSTWRFTSAAGEQVVHVVDVNPRRRGVTLGYRANPELRMRAPTSRILAGDKHAVAGTNGNYFDVHDTGAPLGVGRSRRRGALHAPTSGWNSAFYQAADGKYRIGTVALTAAIRQYPTWPLTGLNVPHARPEAITMYTPAWGKACGRCVVDAPRTPVREVLVKDGVVRSNSATLMKGRTYAGLRLVGLGRGAQDLRTLAVGSALTATYSLEPRPQMAVTGSQVLVSGSKVVASNDGVVAPRTAVGIDHRTGHVVLATLDGRQQHATGMSLRGWAQYLVGLGIDDAINLDGGGSSTMVARGPDGGPLTVVNQPSLGHERQVPDALVVDYTPPS